MFETRSQSWRDAGLEHEIDPRAARRARWKALLLGLLFVGVVIAYDNREALLGKSTLANLEVPVQIAVVVLLLVLGWAIAREVGRSVGPSLFRRMEPATAGSVGFLIRLVTAVVALLFALRIAGVNPATLVLGGAFTAVIVGLAAQQTLGNVIAGTVLLSAGPFRVGDRVRLQGGQIAGQIDGVVGSLGLLYTTLVTDDGSVLVPNSVVLNVAILTRRGRPSSAAPAGPEPRSAERDASDSQTRSAAEARPADRDRRR
jgi:small conductance mechanosensitive channel